MAGKKLTALEMPEEDEPAMMAAAVPAPAAPAPTALQPPVAEARPGAVDYRAPASIPLPPIPAAPVRRVMVQLSIKAPVDLVDRLEAMTNATRAQKQAVIAAALDAYMRGHGY
jgi:hypothetical protein